MMPRMTVGDTAEGPFLGRMFGRLIAIYGLIWLAILIGFAAVSHPLLKGFAESQAERKLRAEAALVEEYISAVGAYSKSYRPVLERICSRLSQPDLLDARVTLFSPKSEVIADSRPGSPFATPPLVLPEVEAALRKEVGTSVRYSRSDGRRMSFAAYPHIHLGKVECVIRIGEPNTSIDLGLWRAYLAIAAAGLGLSIVAAALSSLFIFYRLGAGPAEGMNASDLLSARAAARR